MADCGKLKRGITAPCTPAAAGLKTQLVQVRYSDILSAVRHAANPKLVVLTLAQGAKGYLFQGLGESIAARSKLTPTKYGTPAYTHEVDQVAFVSGPVDMATAEDLAKDVTVSVVPDNNGNYLIYGLNAGLKVTKSDTDSANKDTGGVPEMTLASANEIGHADYFVVLDAQASTATTPVVDPVATKAAFAALYS